MGYSRKGAGSKEKTIDNQNHAISTEIFVSTEISVRPEPVEGQADYKHPIFSVSVLIGGLFSYPFDFEYYFVGMPHIWNACLAGISSAQSSFPYPFPSHTG
ncbi:MAG TPA: hypothetical protein ENI68_03245 [Gammaproteobacteria bacterium]|nr:hypothetical protein [Gammaproteobacteria bacterium]